MYIPLAIQYPEHYMNIFQIIDNNLNKKNIIGKHKFDKPQKNLLSSSAAIPSFHRPIYLCMISMTITGIPLNLFQLKLLENTSLNVVSNDP